MKETDHTSWMDSDGPYIIAGPCSVESEAQVRNVAEALGQQGVVKMLRGGVWKPRTRPDSFEGIGESALSWLKNAAQDNGMLSLTEVANAKHVEAALAAGIDALWIGARTTVNPFYVQEIAEALKGSDLPVFVKNPLNPDLQLWIGALERLEKVGITKLAAIHRGFSPFHDSRYRNDPMWHVAIELATRHPKLPLICDPSHISGKRDGIAEVSQKALDLNMDGLMIECHPDPDQAWSDAAQQVTPERLAQILEGLVVRQVDPGDQFLQTQLGELRNTIDELDERLIRTLFERYLVVQKIGEYKKENQMTILQPERWAEILDHMLGMAKELGMDQEFVKALMQVIHNESIRRQTDILNDGKHMEIRS